MPVASKPLLPKRRFPEFLNGPIWTTELLGSRGEFLSPLTGKTASDFDTGGARFIPYMNVYLNPFTNKMDLRQVNVAIGESQNAVEVGDVFFTVSSETPNDAGMSSVLLEPIENCFLNSFCALFRFYPGESPNTMFLGHMLRAAPVRQHLVRGAQGATRYNVSKGVFRDVPLLLPLLEEQQKIAECMTSLDELIAAEREKLEVLCAQKQGLIQRLFPRPEHYENGVRVPPETAPRVRFPGTWIVKDWSVEPAGKFFSNRVERGRAGLPIYSVTMNDGMVRRSSLDRKVDDIATPEGNKLARKGDIVYYMMRMWQGALGVAPEDCMVSPAYIVLKPQPGTCSEFFAQYFKLPASLHQLTAHSRGLTEDRLRLYFDDFARVPVTAPDEREQERIAQFLKSIDDLVSVQGQRIETLRKHKQGLLADLFPSLGEEAK